jgi:hypothetical protein
MRTATQMNCARWIAVQFPLAAQFVNATWWSLAPAGCSTPTTSKTTKPKTAALPRDEPACNPARSTSRIDASIVAQSVTQTPGDPGWG